MIDQTLPVLLIPGLLCTDELFAPQRAALSPHRPVLVADHRGAASDDVIAAQILATAPRRFALAGLSMGGYLALSIVRQAPDRVERLALLDTSARPDPAAATERRSALMQLARSGHFHEVADIHFPSFVHKDRSGDAMLKAIVRRMAADTGAEAYIRQQTAIAARPDRREMLPSIRCPTLVLVGDADELTPPDLSKELAAAIPDARLAVIAACGHLSTLEQPTAVSAELSHWLGLST